LLHAARRSSCVRLRVTGAVTLRLAHAHARRTLHEALHLRPVAEERNLSLLPLRIHNQHHVLPRKSGEAPSERPNGSSAAHAAHMPPPIAHAPLSASVTS
jgi:hypothetical protein